MDKRTRSKVGKNGEGIADRIAKRNKVIVARFYYWSECKRVRRDDVLRTLSQKEFFVDERTITRVLQDEQKMLSEMCETNPTLKQLGQMFPRFNFS